MHSQRAPTIMPALPLLWVVRVGGDDGELRPWHYIYVYSIESRLIMRVRYDSHIRLQFLCGWLFRKPEG